MRLIFIRHGDPDYKNDSLTEKGNREVSLLTERVCKWKNITAFYTSPLGRAQNTIAPSLTKLGRTQITKDWLQEFHYSVKDPFTGENRLMWDLKPSYFCSKPDFFNKDKWYKTKFIKSGNGKNYYDMVCNGIDEILSEYGYKRKGLYYKVSNQRTLGSLNPEIKKYQLISEKHQDENYTLVFTCHLGVMFAIISHLINISPMQLWQGFYVPPTSVTIINSEEVENETAWFRVERLGDTQHLTKGGEPISSSGYFTDLLNEV
ncbi:MAG: histidine phosphatase family protein [Treponema sp.]|nr:histidine phosphatase family protein [Treponema sp.]